MIRWLLEVIFLALAVRAISRLIGGIIQGVSGQTRQVPRGGPPSHGVQMVRDPVCGTYVVPDRAVSLTEGRTQLYFCSAACRDQYRARPSAPSGRPERVEGRTA